MAPSQGAPSQGAAQGAYNPREGEANQGAVEWPRQPSQMAAGQPSWEARMALRPLDTAWHAGRRWPCKVGYLPGQPPQMAAGKGQGPGQPPQMAAEKGQPPQIPGPVAEMAPKKQAAAAASAVPAIADAVGETP